MRRKAGVRCQEEAAMNSEVGIRNSECGMRNVEKEKGLGNWELGMRNAEKKKGASHKAHGARQGAIKAITNSVSQLRVLSSDFCIPYSDL